MQLALGIGLVIFFTMMIGISLWAGRKIHSGEDFIVAGRGLSALMTTATIIATWYAAETILVTADVVRTEGLRVIVLEPLGIGICLIIAGYFFARKLWETKQLTLADVMRLHFGPVAEKFQALIAFSYIGWVAVQLLSLAAVFQVFFGMPLIWGVILITIVLTLYTLIGGMWSVAMTDIVQLGLLLVGITILTFRVLAELAGGPLTGLAALFDQLDAKLLVLVPTESFEELRGWLGLLVIGVVANIPTQDLVQRMFSAKSAAVAEKSTIWAGVLYIVFGALPVLLGLSGSLLLDESVTQGVIPALAEQLLSPTIAVIFALTLTAAITSSVDSGLLAPASVAAKNVIGPMLKDRISLIALTRICVVVIAVISAMLALSGTGAYDLIQGTYSISIPPFVVLTAALYQKNTRMLPGTLTLGVGILVWMYEIGSNVLSEEGAEVISDGFTVVLLLMSIAIYVVTDRLVRFFETRARGE